MIIKDGVLISPDSNEELLKTRLLVFLFFLKRPEEAFENINKTLTRQKS